MSKNEKKNFLLILCNIIDCVGEDVKLKKRKKNYDEFYRCERNNSLCDTRVHFFFYSLSYFWVTVLRITHARALIHSCVRPSLYYYATNNDEWVVIVSLRFSIESHHT